MVNPDRRNCECWRCDVVGFHRVDDYGGAYCEECYKKFEEEEVDDPEERERERELDRQYEIDHGIAPDPEEEAERQRELERQFERLRLHPWYVEDPRGPKYGLVPPRPENGHEPPRPGID